VATPKNTTLTLRVNPVIKEGLRLLAEKEHRSLTNRIKVIIRDYCNLLNVTLPESSKPFSITQTNCDKYEGINF
jgi:hypothetical protein